MKRLVFVSLALFSTSAFSTSADIGGILANAKVVALDAVLTQRGYALVSVVQTEGRNPHTSAATYRLKFQRGLLESGQSSTFEVAAYVTDEQNGINVRIPDPFNID